MNKISLYEKVPPLENNFTIKFMEFERTNGLLPHWHEHLELLYFTKGECELIIGGNRLTARSGDLAIVNTSEVHSFTSIGEVHYFCALIYPGFFADIDFHGVRLKPLVRGDEFVKMCFSNMSAEQNEGKDLPSRLMLKSHTLSLLSYLVRHFSDRTPSVDEVGRDRALLKRLALIADYVAENYTQNISTKDLAKMCFVCENHFCRFFKRITGKSAINYINEYRIERAAALLESTDATVLEIANSVGICDPNYFTRIFKRVKGKSPKDFRKHSRQA